MAKLNGMQNPASDHLYSPYRAMHTKLKIWVVTMQIITNFIHMILKEITLQGLCTGITHNPL